jgi:hypothetical protein
MPQIWYRSAVCAVVPFILALTACASSPPLTAYPDAEQQAATSPDASCTTSGAYRVVPSANGSFPLLPVSPQGPDSTPLVRLSSTHLKNSPPTVDLSVASFTTGEQTSSEFPGLALGQEAGFDGYTIKITSICEKEALFDLVTQPG